MDNDKWLDIEWPMQPNPTTSFTYNLRSSHCCPSQVNFTTLHSSHFASLDKLLAWGDAVNINSWFMLPGTRPGWRRFLVWTRGELLQQAGLDSNHCTAVHQQDTLDTGQFYLALRKTCLMLNSANIWAINNIFVRKNLAKTVQEGLGLP